MASTRAQVRQRKGLGRQVLPVDRQRRAGDVSGIVLDGRRADMQLGRRLLDATLERSIEGPDTLTLSIWDRDGAVLGSGILGERIMASKARVDLDGLGWIAASTSRSDGILSVGFEPEVFRILKRHGLGKPLKVVRGASTTRAGFCADMIRDAGVPVIVLDELVVQPIASGDLAAEVKKAKGQSRSRGRTRTIGATGSDLTIKGQPASQEQRRNVAKALRRAEVHDAPDVPTLGMLLAGIAEGQFVTDRPNQQGSGAVGPWQIMPDTARSLGISQTDVDAGADAFLVGINGRSFTGGPGAIELARRNPSMGPADIANAIEGGGAGAGFYLGNGVYDGLAEAKRWLRAAGNGLDDGGDVEDEDFTFERHKTESTYAACRRLLDEVKWRLFAREGVVIIAHDLALMRAMPSLELEEGTDALPGFLDFDWARALRVGEATGSVYARRYQVDPGETVDVLGLPQTHRTWLLATATESLMARTGLVAITLRKPQEPAAEPANETSAASDPDSASAGGSSGVQAALARAKEIAGQHLPYAYGGGHTRLGEPSLGGYDCSGFVSAVLAAGGFTETVMDTTVLGSWGEAGRGRELTVWVRPLPGAQGHTFVEFTDGGFYEANGPAGTIIGYRGTSRSTAGYEPRHPAGS